MDFYSQAAMERAMKVQEVILRALRRTTTCLLAARFHRTLSQQVQLVLVQTALQTEQESIVAEPGCVDHLLIDQHGVHDAADLYQFLPFAAVARSEKPRGGDSSHYPQADFGHYALESRPRDHPGSRSSQVIIHDFNLVPSQLMQPRFHCVLQLLTLQVVNQLVGFRRITDSGYWTASASGNCFRQAKERLNPLGSLALHRQPGAEPRIGSALRELAAGEWAFGSNGSRLADTYYREVAFVPWVYNTQDGRTVLLPVTWLLAMFNYCQTNLLRQRCRRLRGLKPFPFLPHFPPRVPKRKL